MEGVQQELANLLGLRVLQVRKTRESPPRISAIDVAIAVSGKCAKSASKDIAVVKERYPEMQESLKDYKFRGKRQRPTPVCDARGVAELVLLLPGQHALAQALCHFPRFFEDAPLLLRVKAFLFEIDEVLAGLSLRTFQ